MGHRFLRAGFPKFGLKFALLSAALLAACCSSCRHVERRPYWCVTSPPSPAFEKSTGRLLHRGGTERYRRPPADPVHYSDPGQRNAAHGRADSRSSVIVKNVAAVFVTASLPPFARPGMPLDVTVSSIGDAKSLEGGVLLLAPLRGPDGQVYAEAQGPLTLGGYSAGGVGERQTVKPSNRGTYPERRNRGAGHSHRPESPEHGFARAPNADFTSAREISNVINSQFGKTFQPSWTAVRSM